MDHNDPQYPQKSEPRLEPGSATVTTSAPAAPAGQDAAVATGEMPAWLAKQAAPPTAGQRWGRRIMFLGAAVVAVAVAGGATLLGLEMYESRKAKAAAASGPATPIAPPEAIVSTDNAAAPPVVERRPSNVPPLVLVPQDPNAKKEVAVPATPDAAAAAVAAPPEAAQATAAPVPVTNVDKVDKVSPATPVVPGPAAGAPARPADAAKPAATPVKKQVAPAKRVAKPVLPRVQPPKPVAGRMLQPPRDRSNDREDDNAGDYEPPPPRRAIDRRCRPGELARECEARTR